MRSIKLFLCCLPWIAACTPPDSSQPDAAQPAAQATPESNVVLYEGARLIVGDGSTLDNSAFLVEDGRISEVGAAGTLEAPPESVRVDLTGKTVMPAVVDLHVHVGFSDITEMTTGVENYSRQNIVDHLQRTAYYGGNAVLSMGIDGGDMPLQLRQEEIAGAARFRSAGPGVARPNAGPGAADRRHIPYGVDTEDEARAAVRELAAKKVDIVKIWVDDRNGSVEQLTPALYGAVIDEAHLLGLRVAAHIFDLQDAKGLLRAGVDGLAHGVRDRPIDDEFMALLAGRPYTFLIPNLPDSGARTADDLTFMAETMPAASIADMREALTEGTEEDSNESFQIQADNLARMYEAGVTVGFGTDAGGTGWNLHEEMADMVASGMTPADVLVAATGTSARLLRLHDLGTITAGKSADFLVLDANPLDDIKNTRRISSVYIRGEAVDRTTLAASWTGT